MASRFFKYNQKFGFGNAIKLYMHLKAKSNKPIKFSFLQQPVYIRNIYSDIAIFEQIFINDEYKISCDFNPKTIVDLGANVGYASLYFTMKFPEANIVALEPEINNFNTAKQNLNNYSNITLLQGAVWHNNDPLYLIDEGLGEAGFMVNENKNAKPIKAFTIKDIMQMLNSQHIDILKIDIEGAEKEIFENNYESWLPYTKIILVETHDRYRAGTSKAVFEAINKYNFSLSILGENLVFTNNNL